MKAAPSAWPISRRWTRWPTTQRWRTTSAVFASLRAHGLEPFVTVNHFTLPAWVHDPIMARPLIQLGLPAPAAGWLSPTTPVEFEKYAAYLAWKYGDQVDNWATLNEPFPPVLTEFLAIPGLVPNWPPGVIRPDLASTFLVNEAKGHVAAYDAIHLWDQTSATIGQPKAFVGFTNNMIPARPANPLSQLDVDAADAWNKLLQPLVPQRGDQRMGRRELRRHPDTGRGTRRLHRQGRLHGRAVLRVAADAGLRRRPDPGIPVPQRPSGAVRRGVADVQRLQPAHGPRRFPRGPRGRGVIQFANGTQVPLWITENGIADDEDTKRPSYIVNHVAVVQDLVAHGMDIRGYTYWSFVDNLEWSEGYHLQFGLYGSDPTTPELERTPKPASISAIKQIATSNGLPTGLLGLYIPTTL